MLPRTPVLRGAGSLKRGLEEQQQYAEEFRDADPQLQQQQTKRVKDAAGNAAAVTRRPLADIALNGSNIRLGPGAAKAKSVDLFKSEVTFRNISGPVKAFAVRREESNPAVAQQQTHLGFSSGVVPAIAPHRALSDKPLPKTQQIKNQAAVDIIKIPTSPSSSHTSNNNSKAAKKVIPSGQQQLATITGGKPEPQSGATAARARVTRNAVPLGGRQLARTPVGTKLDVLKAAQPPQRENSSRKLVPISSQLVRTSLSEDCARVLSNAGSGSASALLVHMPVLETTINTKRVHSIIPNGKKVDRTPVGGNDVTSPLASATDNLKAAHNTVPSENQLMHTSVAGATVDIKATRNMFPNGEGLARTPIDNDEVKTTRNMIPNGEELARTPVGDDEAAATRNMGLRNDKGLALTCASDDEVTALCNFVPTGERLARTPIGNDEMIVPFVVAKDDVEDACNDVPSSSQLSRTPVGDAAEQAGDSVPNPFPVPQDHKVKTMIPTGKSQLQRTPPGGPPATITQNRALGSVSESQRKNLIPTGSSQLLRTPQGKTTTSGGAANLPQSQKINSAQENNILRNAVLVDPKQLTQTPMVEECMVEGTGHRATPGTAENPGHVASKNIIPTGGTQLQRTPVGDAATAVSVNVSKEMKQQQYVSKVVCNMVPGGKQVARTPIGATDADLARAQGGPQNESSSSLSPSFNEQKLRNVIPAGASQLARTPVGIENLETVATVLAMPPPAPVEQRQVKNLIPGGKQLARTPLGEVPAQTSGASSASAPESVVVAQFRNAVPSGRQLARTPVTGDQAAGNVAKDTLTAPGPDYPEVQSGMKTTPLYVATPTDSMQVGDDESVVGSESIQVKENGCTEDDSASVSSEDSMSTLDSISVASQSGKKSNAVNRVQSKRQNSFTPASTNSSASLSTLSQSNSASSTSSSYNKRQSSSFAEQEDFQFDDAQSPSPNRISMASHHSSNSSSSSSNSTGNHYSYNNDVSKLERLETTLRGLRRFCRKNPADSVSALVRSDPGRFGEIAKWMQRNAVVAPGDPIDADCVAIALNLVQSELEETGISSKTRVIVRNQKQQQHRRPQIVAKNHSQQGDKIQRNVVSKKLSEGAQVLGVLEAAISETKADLKKYTKQMAQDEALSIQIQHSCLEKELRNLQTMQSSNSCSNSSIRRLFRRVELFLVRYESMRRTAKRLQRYLGGT